MSIAGQIFVHNPQSVHFSSLTNGDQKPSWFSFISMAFLGQML